MQNEITMDDVRVMDEKEKNDYLNRISDEHEAGVEVLGLTHPGEETMTNTATVTRWQELGLQDGDGQTDDRSLGEWIAEADERNLARITMVDGKIESWDGINISDTDEFDWDTPRGPVDWTGFESAVNARRAAIAAE